MRRLLCRSPHDGLGEKPWLASSPSHRDQAARPAPSPLGPGYNAGDYGSDMSGLVTTSTGNVDSPKSEVGNSKKNSASDKEPTLKLGLLAPPMTPKHASSRQLAKNSDPPVLNGRTTGICNLPFITLTNLLH